jgi:hypothetical protein
LLAPASKELQSADLLMGTNRQKALRNRNQTLQRVPFGNHFRG